MPPLTPYYTHLWTLRDADILFFHVQVRGEPPHLADHHLLSRRDVHALPHDVAKGP